jgi:hypothetical protein
VSVPPFPLRSFRISWFNFASLCSRFAVSPADPARKFIWDEWPVEQFTQKLCELFGQNPHTASPKIIAAARSIAEALKSLPIDGPRAVRISRALDEVAELDPDSEEELNEAIMGFALELKNLFQ